MFRWVRHKSIIEIQSGSKIWGDLEGTIKNKLNKLIMYLFKYFECCSNLDENTLNVVGICECGSINLAVY